MRNLTITEALAELKTLDKRIAKKREFIGQYVIRQEQFKDPLLAQGGSPAAIVAERQSLADLESNAIAIRAAIQHTNSVTQVTVGSTTRSITQWLIWRRDVAPGQQQFLSTLRQTIQKYRNEAQRIGASVHTAAATDAAQPKDIIVNLDERALADEAEALENTLGTLDGLLSLKNATVTIEVP